MSDKDDKHLPQWRKYSELYKNLAKVQSKDDPMFYRHRAIEGLISGNTVDYGESESNLNTNIE